MTNKTLIESNWPYKIDFEEIEDLEIEYYPAKIIYKSFFSCLHLPGLVLGSFIEVLFTRVNMDIDSNQTAQDVEKYFFKIFDEAFSLNEDEREINGLPN